MLNIVVDDVSDWSPYFPSENVISFADYLGKGDELGRATERVINLCRAERYLSRGYYCSLLAEARGHRVIPGVATLNLLRNRRLFVLQFEDLANRIEKVFADLPEGDMDRLALRSYFGKVENPAFASLAKHLFERLACPILEIEFKRRRRWEITSLRPLSPRDLTEDEQTFFAEALDHYSRAVWRKPKSIARYRYDMAILVDPEDPQPPSDPKAIRQFMRAGKKLGIAVDLIKRGDYGRLPEYDALFIRATTAIDHFTYRFSQRAEAEGLVVMDDPTSILRCTNKVYLADLLRKNKVAAPDTRILVNQGRDSILRSVEGMAYPIVLKIPDGSFSKGVVKVSDANELLVRCGELFKRSALLLAQEYLYTDYDWRIGVLNGRAIYACKYFMVRDHWQIYRYGEKGGVDSGSFQTMPTHEAPRPVIEAALKATRLIGDGLYGVDVKEAGKRVAVIEVNDNPSLESSVEDAYLGFDLYHLIMEDFLRRLEGRRQDRP